ncbi:MAG: large subunit ribosomal protein L5 [Alphaproteobacteria bacterium]|jgi:large subunit ribosomal protein L5
MSSNTLSDKYTSRYREQYNSKIISLLKESLSLKNIMEVPHLEKIVLNSCYSPAVTDSKKLKKLSSELSLIAGQSTVMTKARRSLAGFHLREGMPLGVKVTLRKDNMYDFLDKLINIAMPRIKDFNAYDSNKHFDHHANFNFGLVDQTIFPEIDYDNIDFSWGMNVTIVTSTSNKEHSKALLEQFNFPFKKSASK